MESKDKEFTIEEFDELLDQLIPRLACNESDRVRLRLALLAVLEESGQQGIDALREFVRQKEN